MYNGLARGRDITEVGGMEEREKRIDDEGEDGREEVEKWERRWENEGGQEMRGMKKRLDEVVEDDKIVI